MEMKHYFVNYDNTFFGQMHIYPNNGAFVSILHPLNSEIFNIPNILKYDVNEKDEIKRISETFSRFCGDNSSFEHDKFECVNSNDSFYITYRNAFVKALNDSELLKCT